MSDELPKFKIQGKWKILNNEKFGEMWGMFEFDQLKEISSVRILQFSDKLFNFAFNGKIGGVDILGTCIVDDIIKYVYLCHSRLRYTNPPSLTFDAREVFIGESLFDFEDTQFKNAIVNFAMTDHWLRNEIFTEDSTDPESGTYKLEILRGSEVHRKLDQYSITIVPNRTELYNNPKRVETNNCVIFDFENEVKYTYILKKIEEIRNFLILLIGQEVYPVSVKFEGNDRKSFELFKIYYNRNKNLNYNFPTIDYNSIRLRKMIYEFVSKYSDLNYRYVYYNIS